MRKAMETIDTLPAHYRIAGKLVAMPAAELLWLANGASEAEFYRRINTVRALQENLHEELLQKGLYGQSDPEKLSLAIIDRVSRAFSAGQHLLPKHPITKDSRLPAPVRKARRSAYLQRYAKMRNSLGRLGR